MNLDFIKSVAGDQRRDSFVLAVELFTKIYDRTSAVVETGTIRTRINSPDGQSTNIFAEVSRSLKVPFYSIDLSPEHIATSKEVVTSHGLGEHVNWVTADSVTFLGSFGHPIQLLYLDSYDFQFENPGPAQRHELAELGAAYSKLHPKCIILLDDCGIEHEGKGYLGTRFLRDRGWKMIHDKYQRLFINFEA